MEQHACTYSVLIHSIDPWGGVNGQNILVMLHIKLKGMDHIDYASTNCILIHTPDPWGGVKGRNIFFPESSHVAYQIKGNRA